MSEEAKPEDDAASDYDTLLVAVGMRIRAARLRAGLGQTALSKMIQSSQSQVGAIELGMTSPNLRSLVRIAEALRVSPVSFLEDTDEHLKSVVQRLSHTLAVIEDAERKRDVADRARADFGETAAALLMQALTLLKESIAHRELGESPPEPGESPVPTKREI